MSLLQRLFGRGPRVAPIADELARAYEAYEAGDHEAALAIWSPLAQQGIARAQTAVGACFAYGQGVERDDALAVRWFRLAAEAGDAAGRRNLALCYQAFPVLEERARQLAGSMSGGQQQMLAIARAIMSAPRLLLVDEPSVGLSPVLVIQTINIIRQLKEQFGLTVLMAEQNFHEASRIADRGYIIVHGEIAFEGRNLAELRESDLVKSYYLGT